MMQPGTDPPAILTVDGGAPGAATAALAGAGCVILRRVFSPGWLARATERSSPPGSVWPPSIAGALAEPELLDNHQLVPILRSVLGDDYIMGRLAVGVAANEILTRGPGRSGLFGDVHHDLRVPAIGLLLYVWLSPITQAAFADFGGAMRNAGLRFWAVEHVAGMVIAIALVHVGRAKIRKATTDRRRHSLAAIFYGIALIIMLASIPWPGMPAGRPLFRGL